VIYRKKPLIISGEEDVPCFESFSERVLPLAQGTVVIAAHGK